jgi:multiple sugar transport system substrate-binding protein
MKRWKVKPFTFFLLCIAVLFLVFAPKFLAGRLKKQKAFDLYDVKKPEWSGVITIWDIPYVQTGKGNASRWLGRYISRFEKEYPGVFIDVRNLTEERLAMYLHGADYEGILPDMVSLSMYEQALPEGLLLDLSPYFQSNELEQLHVLARKSVESDDRIIGVPWMMGSYGLIVNNNALSDTDAAGLTETLDYAALDELARKMSYQKKSGRKTIDYFGFCTYTTSGSRPLLSMIYGEDGKIVDNAGYGLFDSWRQQGGIFPPEMETYTYAKAFRMLAVDKRAAMLLGSSKAVYDIRNLQQSGKGIEFSVFSVPTGNAGQYQDQVAAYGVLKGDSDEKTKLCIQFLKGLLDEEVQRQLTDLGMFSVINNMSLYAEDSEMHVLEKALQQADKGPFEQGRLQADALWKAVSDAGYR